MNKEKKEYQEGEKKGEMYNNRDVQRVFLQLSS